jgi:hypothetical protein
MVAMMPDRWRVVRHPRWGLFIMNCGEWTSPDDKDVLAEGSRDAMFAALRLLKS